MKCDLASFKSVREFSDNLKEYLSGRPLDRLVCNAAVYQPTLSVAQVHFYLDVSVCDISVYFYNTVCLLFIYDHS